jgi:hypothetical protein
MTSMTCGFLQTVHVPLIRKVLMILRWDKVVWHLFWCLLAFWQCPWMDVKARGTWSEMKWKAVLMIIVGTWHMIRNERESCAHDYCKSEAWWKFILRELNVRSSKKDDLAESFLGSNIKFPFSSMQRIFIGIGRAYKKCVLDRQTTGGQQSMPLTCRRRPISSSFKFNSIIRFTL